MSSNLNFVIDQVGKDKGIDRKVIIEALEQAVLTASRKKSKVYITLDEVVNII